MAYARGYKKPIFWTKNSVNKPTYEFFESNYLNFNADWDVFGEILPNWIDYYTCTIVVPKNKNYTYFEVLWPEDVVGANKFYYYFVERVEKQLKNAKVLRLTLDVFMTHITCNTFLKNEILSVPLLINRSSAVGLWYFNYQAQIADDPLIPKNYALRKIGNGGGIERFTNLNSRLYYNFDNKRTLVYQSNGTGSFNFIGGYGASELSNLRWDSFYRYQYLYESALFDVYQEPDGDFWCFAIFDAYGRSKCDIRSVESSHSYSFKNYVTFSEDDVGFLRKNNYLVNKYIGRFYIPNWLQICKSCNWIVVEMPTFNHWGFIIPVGINKYKIERDITYIYGYIYNWQTHSNSWLTNWLLSYAFCKAKTPGSNVPLLMSDSKVYTHTPGQSIGEYQDLWINYSENGQATENKFLFDPVNGLQIFANISDFSGVALSGFQTFPTTTNQYKQYIAGAAAQQNASLVAAKNNSILSGAKGITNAISGTFSSLSDGNIGSAFSSVINGGFGLVSNALQYARTFNSIQAQHLDKMNVATANNFMPTTTEHNYYNSAIAPYKSTYQTNNFSDFDGYFIALPDEDENTKTANYSTTYLNNIIIQNGLYLNTTLVLDDYLRVVQTKYNTRINLTFENDYINNFIYWDITIDYDWVNKTLKDEPQEIKEAVHICLNQPFRLWKRVPDNDMRYDLKYAKRTSFLSTPQQNNLSILTFNYLLSRLK